VITESLKRLVREKRPHSPTERTSFPSGHATAAFTVATMQSAFHPRQAPLWYGAATLIAASRVKLHRHYVHDAVAGAAVGYFAARYALKVGPGSRRLTLSPLAAPMGGHGSYGLQLSKQF